jgi:hypothetical protein
MPLPDLPESIPMDKVREAFAVIGVPDLKGLYAVEFGINDVTFKRRAVDGAGKHIVKTKTTVQIDRDRVGNYHSNKWGE